MKHPSWLLGWALLAGLLLPPGRAAAAQPAANRLRQVLADTRRPDTARARAAIQLARAETDQARALALFRRALALLPAAAERQRLDMLDDMAAAQGRSGDLTGSLRTLQQLLALARRRHDIVSQMTALRNMGVAAEALGDTPGAVAYFRQALAVPGAPLADRLVTQATLSQALLFSEQPGAQAEAERLILRTLAEATTAYAAGRVPRTTYNVAAIMAGRVLLERDNAAAGVALARRELARLAPLLTTAPALDDLLTASDLRLTLADGLVMQEQYAPAAREARTSLALAERGHLTNSLVDILPVLVEALEKSGDPVAALRYQRRLGALTDSLSSAARTREAQRLQTQFETREKEARIRELAQRAELAAAAVARQRQRVWALGVVLAAVLAGGGVGAGLYVRLRRSQQRLQQLTRLKDQLFAIIGHDLRAPVTGFRQVTPLLYTLADYPDPAELRELARSFDQTSAQLADLLDNMLHWGRVQTQSLAPQPEAVAVGALLHQEVRLISGLAAAKQVRVRVAVPAALPPLATDPVLLRVVVRNLLANAVKYSRAGGEVTLSAAPAAAGATTLAVADAGVGMAAATLALVLSADGPTQSRRGTAGEAGTGLGLRVARAFSRELGGTLTGESQPDQGTTFRLTLPGGAAA